MYRTLFVSAALLILFCFPVNLQGAPLADRDVADDVFYMFMPIAWRDSDNDTYRFGDIGGMIDSLDYLEYLGVTAIWMTPIFPSPAYHGYQHGPGNQVNSRLGTEADFWNFVSAAHARDIKVFIDFVVYGISQDTVWFQDSYGNPSSIYDNWMSYYNYDNTNYYGNTYNTWNGDFVGFIHWNLNHQAVTDMVTGWAVHWLDPDGNGDPADGIDGFRLDHVSAWDDGESPWGYHIDWWEDWKAELLQVNPDVFTFAEQADWGSHGVDLLPAFDAAMTKPFLFAARNALAAEDSAELYSQMKTTVSVLPEGKTFLATFGDHDVDRLLSVIGGSVGKAKIAAAVFMTQPFPPVIYYGDEIGMRGTKQDYGSDANDIPLREPFKWNAVASSPMSNYWILNSQAHNNAFAADNDGRSVEEQMGNANSLLEAYRYLIGVRKDHVALRRGGYAEVPNSSSRVWAFVRHAENQETLLVAINIGNATQNASLDLSSFEIPGGTTTVQNALTGAVLADMTDANKGAYSISLPPYTYRILSLNVIPTETEIPSYDGLDIPNDMGARALVATQDNHTAMGDNVSELNQMFLKRVNNTIRFGVTGNLSSIGAAMMLLVDSIPGGQSTLSTGSFSTPPSTIHDVNGMTMDSGFKPDVIIHVNTYSGGIYVDYFELDSAGGGTKRYIGGGTVDDLDGFLTGGTNPGAMMLAVSDSNSAGVTSSDASTAPTATAGFEGEINISDLLLSEATGTIKVMAMIVSNDGTIGNQFLPGLGGGYGNLGDSPIDLNTIPGNQYVTFSLTDTPGDWNYDGAVDLADYEHFADCLAGPYVSLADPDCEVFDLDTDGDVDLVDFAVFQQLIVASGSR